MNSPLCFQVFDPAALRVAGIKPIRDLEIAEKEVAEGRSSEAA